MKKIDTLVMKDSEMTFEVKKRKQVKTKKPKFVKEELNLAAINLNTAKVASRLFLSQNYLPSPKYQRIYRRQQTYISK